MGTAKEPNNGIVLFAGTSTGASDPALIFHAGLTVYDERGNLLPRIAQKVPAVEDGDWKVGPDGRTEVIWRIRPGIRWHDGTPLSIEDFFLGMHVLQDDEIPATRDRWVGFVSDIQPLDSESFVVIWRQPYILANASGPLDLVALPNHLLGRLYEAGEKHAFINSVYWTRDFVGLGPYRMGEWVPGSDIEALAFEGYFLGRPPIDRLLVRYYADPAAIVAALLAGDIDGTPVGSIKVEEALAIKNSWDPAGAGSVISSPNGLGVLYLQYRDPLAPWVRDVRVRRALAHFLDRQTLVDTLQFGLTTVADTLPPPDDPVYRLVEQRGLSKYPYDPLRGQQLLAESGWSRGPGGVYQDATGQRFTIEVRTVVVTQEFLQEILAVSDQFKTAGLESPIFQITRGAANSSELRAKAEGVFATNLDDTPETLSRFSSSQIATERNGWRGQNVWGYANPVFDDMYDRYLSTLDLGRRQNLQADMLKMAADDVIFIPLWYYAGATLAAFRTGVRGPGPSKAVQQASTWSIHTWELD